MVVVGSRAVAAAARRGMHPSQSGIDELVAGIVVPLVGLRWFLQRHCGRPGVRLGRCSVARQGAEDRIYSVHAPARLRVLWDNPLNDLQYADVIFLPLIARQVEGWNTGTTP